MPVRENKQTVSTPRGRRFTRAHRHAADFFVGLIKLLDERDRGRLIRFGGTFTMKPQAPAALRLVPKEKD